jgi:chromosomal replication initiator protein
LTLQQFFDFPVVPTCTFDSFGVCPGNAVALEFARRIADTDDSENLLYLHGPAGSGKTHLLTAIGNALSRTPASDSPLLSFRESCIPDDLTSRFTGASVLLVDDLHLMPADAALHNALWQLFNDFHASGRKIAMSGIVPPRELPHLDDHLVSRLLWGLIARVDASDDASRRMVIMKVAEDRQIRIPDDVVDYILMTASREVADLISAFDNLYRLSMTRQRKISLQLAREARDLQLNDGGLP